MSAGTAAAAEPPCRTECPWYRADDSFPPSDGPARTSCLLPKASGCRIGAGLFDTSPPPADSLEVAVFVRPLEISKHPSPPAPQWPVRSPDDDRGTMLP